MSIVIVTTMRSLPPEPLGRGADALKIKLLTVPGADLSRYDGHVVRLPRGAGARFADRISAMLQRSVVLRMILRISPLDGGARFWRAVRHDSQVDSLLLGAELLVAADRDANLACWHLARRADVAAVSGLSAAQKVIDGRLTR